MPTPECGLLYSYLAHFRVSDLKPSARSPWVLAVVRGVAPLGPAPGDRLGLQLVSVAPATAATALPRGRAAARPLSACAADLDYLHAAARPGGLPGSGLDKTVWLPNNTELVSITKKKNTDTGHYGEMASWQMRGVMK